MTAEDAPADRRLVEFTAGELEEPFGQRIDVDGAVFEHDTDGERRLGTVPSDVLRRLVEFVQALDLDAIDHPEAKGTVIGGLDIMWTVGGQTRTFEALVPDSVPILEDLWMRFAYAVSAAIADDPDSEG